MQFVVLVIAAIAVSLSTLCVTFCLPLSTLVCVYMCTTVQVVARPML